MSGYVYCAHPYCFAIIIGVEGDLCDDCKDAPDDEWCDGCDNDADVS